MKLWTSPWLVCPGIHIIISAVRADSMNIRQSVFTTNTVQGLVALLTLGLDPNFDSIYKGSFRSLVMRCDSKLSDHPASKSLHMMFPMHLGHCSEFDLITTSAVGSWSNPSYLCCALHQTCLLTCRKTSPKCVYEPSVFTRWHCCGFISPIILELPPLCGQTSDTILYYSLFHAGVQTQAQAGL